MGSTTPKARTTRSTAPSTPTGRRRDYRVDGGLSDTLSLAVDVPVNTTADVVLPGSGATWVREGGSVLSEVPGVQAVSVIGSKVTVTVGSGSYHFTSRGADAWSGAPLEQALQLRRDVATQVGAGTLSSADGADLDALLGILVERVRVALTKDATGATPTAEVREAIGAVREVRMRLEAALLVSVQSPSAVADLDDGLAGLEEALSDLSSFYWPVSVSLEPLPNQLPGAVVNAKVVVNNALGRRSRPCRERCGSGRAASSRSTRRRWVARGPNGCR